MADYFYSLTVLVFCTDEATAPFLLAIEDEENQ